MRLIDADKLKKDVLDLHDCYNGFSDTYDKACIIGVIDEQPPADVRENVRGEWVSDVAYYDEEGCPCIVSRCNQCGEPNPETNYCPNCGADMRGENNVD